MASEIKQIRQFGKFRLDVGKRVLWHEGEPVNLPMKEIELLCALTEQGGDVITKDELLEKVWADSFVEESNLSRHVYLLRKTFKDYGESDELIQTVPRRGYRFTGEVSKLGNGELVIEKHSLTQTLIEEESVPRAQPWVVSRPRLFVIGAVLVAITAAGIAYLLYNKTPASKVLGIKSIAVLPFKNLSDIDGEEAASGLGMADALITRLGSTKKVIVSPVSAISRYTKSEQDALQIGRSLRVDAVLEGSFQSSNGRLRATARLFKVSDGEQLWSGQFDEEEADFFKIQDSISKAMAQSLALNLTQEEDRLLAKPYLRNAGAYQDYQKGLYFISKREIEKALRYFEQVVEVEPGFAPAYAKIAHCYSWLVEDRILSKQEAALKQRAAVTRSLELDPELSEGHTQLAWLNMTTGNWDLPEIEHEFKLALEANPNNENAHLRYGVYLLGVGRLEEAVWHTKQAQALDPHSLVTNSMVVRALYFAGQYDEAIEQGRIAIEMDKNFPLAYIFLGQSYEQKGMLTEAVPILEKANELASGRNEYLTALAHVYALSGKKRDAEKMLQAIPEDSLAPEYAAAIIHTALGEKEQALTKLEKAYGARDTMILFRLRVDPRFDSIRSEPRFQAILRQMNLGSTGR